MQGHWGWCPQEGLASCSVRAVVVVEKAWLLPDSLTSCLTVWSLPLTQALAMTPLIMVSYSQGDLCQVSDMSFGFSASKTMS